jgi:hypothetical protein
MLHNEFPFCFTENVCPATVIAPLRDDPVGLAATENPTTPLPMPTPFDVIVIQLVLLAACQAHWLVVDTLIVAVPPLAEKVWNRAETE